MDKIVEEIQRRWEQMFTALAAGDDLPPGQRLRTEGLMEAAALLGADPRALQRNMNETWTRAYGQPLEDILGPDWEQFHRFPEIPAFARRAPVYPSTSE